MKLLPFSLGHSLVLTHLESGFITGEPPTYPDLIVTAFVCSSNWRQNQAMLRSPRRSWLTLKLWGWLARRMVIHSQVSALFQYINEARTMPEQKQAPQGTTMRWLASEWDARLYKFLRQSGFGHVESLDMPLVQAHALFVAELEETEKAEFKATRDDAVVRALSSVLDEADASGVWDKVVTN